MQKPPDSLRIQISKVSELADIGSVFSKAVTVNHLLSLILKQALDLTGADVCIIWLKDPSGRLIPKMSFGMKGALIPSMGSRLGSGLVKCIMEKNHPTSVYDMFADKRVTIKKMIRREGLSSLLAAPLAVAGERIGVLMICTKRARRFADVDLKIFDVLARQSALAIANIGLYDKMSRKVKEKAREMTMLFTMSRSLSSAVDIDTMLSIILEKARLLMRARFAVIRVFGSSRKALSILAQAGLSDNKARILAALEDKLSSNVMRGGNPCIINDIEAHFGDKLPAYLKKNRIRSIVIVPLFSAKRRTGTLSVYMPGIRIFTGEEINMIEMVASLASVAIDNSVMLERIRKDYLNMVKTLAKIIDANDSYTRGHCDKVMKYSLAICRRLNIPGRDVNTIKTASLLHDIGKIGIDLSVIHKTDKLTAKDWQSIRMHPEIGAKIVAQVGFLNDIVPIIKHHHARYNGGGYPDPRRKRNRIPLGSRIIAVADAYDAMTSNRPYRKAMSKEDAIAELRKCSGSQFDPEVVKALVNS